MREITVAVAGNPNSGKSTLINAIAGTSLQVGNWPGVTVEKKTAKFGFEDISINLFDLPGTYSLSPYTQEEVIARDFLVKEKPDLIINVVDATNLERNLYLTIQIMELGIPIVMALNIYDEAKKKGIEIDIEKLENLLGIKIVPTVATKKEGIKELLNAVKIVSLLKEQRQYHQKQFNYGEDIEEAIKIIEEPLKIKDPGVLGKYPSRWLCLKLLERDEVVLREIGLKGDENFIKKAETHIVKVHGEEPESMLADIRYGIAHGIAKEVISQKNLKRKDFTEQVDKIVLNRWLGIPIFLFALWFVFKVSFDFSKPFSDWLDGFFNDFLIKWTAHLLSSGGASDWFISLLTEGVIAGVGSVLVFVPLIAMVMFVLTFLEGSGYMARVAFVMDKVMHTIGLHGKSIIPLILGFGCNVPSIYATRVLETERDKKLTALLAPLMSCGARLPVYVLFIGAFFASHGATVLWSLYVLGIFVAVILGFVLKKSLFKGFAPVFIMELPPYRIPTFRDMMIHTWQKLKHFIIKAGTYILGVSVLMWFLLNVPFGVEKENSALGKIGKTLSPVFEPLGFGNWQASASLVSGIMAKEVVVSTMAQIYITEKEEKEEESSISDDLKQQVFAFGKAVLEGFENLFGFEIKTISAEEEEETTPLKERLQQVFTPLSAYAFLVFVLLYWPCVVTAAAMRQEFGTWKIYGLAILLHSTVAWTVAFIIYQVGGIMGF
ncbi:ferrous iron transport protein B [Thermodesulfovibrio hydrogeniphilus]